jgi:hypothetical protein
MDTPAENNPSTQALTANNGSVNNPVTDKKQKRTKWVQLIMFLLILMVSHLSYYVAGVLLLVSIFTLWRVRKYHLKGKWWALFGIGIAVIYFVSVLGIYFFVKSMAPSDSIRTTEAIAKMTPQEKKYLDTYVRKVTPESTEADVISILGQPSEKEGKNESDTLKYLYNCPPGNETDICKIVIDFSGGKVKSVGWTASKRFLYYDDFNSSN